jgi:hypothetical protein
MYEQNCLSLALDNVSKGIEYTIVQYDDLVILSSLNFAAIFLATFLVFQEQIKYYEKLDFDSLYLCTPKQSIFLKNKWKTILLIHVLQY